MKKLIVSALALPVLFSSASALASGLVCNGSYIVYQVQVTANVRGAKVVGPGRVTVNGPGQSQSVPMAIASSSFVAGNSLRFTGVSPDGQNRGTINAVYEAGSGSYNGTAAVVSTQGNFTTQVSCQLY